MKNSFTPPRIANRQCNLTLSLTLFLMIMLTSPYLLHSSFDWTTVTPPPCGTNWGEPKEHKICDYPGKLGCCYTIIYYERWTGTSGNEYELAIAGIFWDGGPNCTLSEIEKSDITKAVTIHLLKQKAVDYQGNLQFPNFRSRVESVSGHEWDWGETKEPGNGTWLWVYSVGYCKDPVTNLICENGVRCCRRKLAIGFSNIEYLDPLNPENNIYYNGIDVNNWLNYDTFYIIPEPCPVPCVINCETSITSGENPNLCERCRGNWNTETEIKTFLYSCCPNCQNDDCSGCNLTPCEVSYEYRYKKNTDPQCPVVDYELINWKACTDICSPQEMTKIHGACVKHMLAHGKKRPNIGEIEIQTRVTEAQCWQPAPKLVPSLLNPPAIISVWDWRECPGNTKCCQTVWQVSNINENITSTLVSTTIPPLQDCEPIEQVNEGGMTMNLCYTFCGEIPVIIEPNSVDNEFEQNIINNDYKITIQPNPSNDYLNIKFDADYSGEFFVCISNVLGEKIIEKTLRKANKVYSFNIEHALSKGIYFIEFYIEGSRMIHSQKFVVN